MDGEFCLSLAITQRPQGDWFFTVLLEVDGSIEPLASKGPYATDAEAQTRGDAVMQRIANRMSAQIGIQLEQVNRPPTAEELRRVGTALCPERMHTFN